MVTSDVLGLHNTLRGAGLDGRGRNHLITLRQNQSTKGQGIARAARKILRLEGNVFEHSNDSSLRLMRCLIKQLFHIDCYQLFTGFELDLANS